MIQTPGVDLALRATGLASGNRLELVRLAARSLSEAARVRAMRDYVVDWILDRDPRFVVLEGQFSSPNQSGQLLVGLHWALRAELDSWAVPVLVVGPQQLRIFATGRAAAVKRAGESASQRRKRAKAELVDAVQARTGRVYESDDVADAEVLQCIGRELLGLPHPMGDDLPYSHRRALDGLQVPTGS